MASRRIILGLGGFWTTMLYESDYDQYGTQKGRSERGLFSLISAVCFHSIGGLQTRAVQIIGFPLVNLIPLHPPIRARTEPSIILVQFASKISREYFEALSK